MKKIILIIAIALMANTANAQNNKMNGNSNAKIIDVFHSWESYEFKEEGSKVCYMASAPKESYGKYTYRGEIVAMITHRPGDASKNVFSFISGYNFKADSEVKVKIDNNTWHLFTSKDTAWTSSEKDDNEIASALQKGSKMTIEGISSRGTKTKDIFSLKGTTNAYKAISRACNIKL